MEREADKGMIRKNYMVRAKKLLNPQAESNWKKTIKQMHVCVT